MKKQKVKIEMSQSYSIRHFTIYIFEQEYANKILDFLVANPLIQQKERQKSATKPKHYLKINFCAHGKSEFSVISSYTKIFILNHYSYELGTIKEIRNYLFKIMTPEQKIKLAYWLEEVE